MKTNKEKYKQAFGVLHASEKISLEVNKAVDRKRTFKASRKFAAACAGVVLSLGAGVTAYAATNGEIFARLWGTAGKENIETHDEIVYDEEKENDCIVTYPEREYEDMEIERAEELIGRGLSSPNITINIHGTTLTILSAVRDSNAAVVELTLEKEGGVDALTFSQLDNESKGAWFSDESTFWMNIGKSGGNIYVDMDKSNGDILYCYYYLALDSLGKTIPMTIQEYPCTRGEYIAAGGNISEDIIQKDIAIPVSELVSHKEYSNEAGGVVEISPISIKTDLARGLNLTNELAADPYSCYKVVIYYKDGSSYVVQEHNNYNHFCDIEIDNTSYSCGSLGTEVTYVFNRLVDVDNIDYISINDVEYRM